MDTNLSVGNEGMHQLLNVPGLNTGSPTQYDDKRRDLWAERFTYVAVRALSEYIASIIAQTEYRLQALPSAHNTEPTPETASTVKQLPAAIEFDERAPYNSTPDQQTQHLVALTAREREVLRLLDEGLSDSAIAAALVVSRRTVNSHLRSIYSKFNVGSRTAAIHTARKAGYL
jgi:DNA-binding NarL/FixJ family response regulator